MALVDRENRRMVGKLAVVAAGMFAFGYALIPIYKHVCEALGINILAVGERQVPGASSAKANTQVDTSRTITVEFDANARGPWLFRPARSGRPFARIGLLVEFKGPPAMVK